MSRSGHRSSGAVDEGGAPVSFVAVERPDDHVVLIRLSRPDRLNAFCREMLEQFAEAVRSASADRACRAIVLTGAGRAFCAGIDVKDSGSAEFHTDRDQVEGHTEWAEYITESLMSVWRSSRPVIAAVNGPAVGAGLSLALLSDLRIGSESATFANGYVRNGLSGCELGTSFLLPRLIGHGLALELMLTGRTVDADESRRIGLLNRVVPPAALEQEAVQLGMEIARNSAFGVTLTKQVAQANLHATDLESAMMLEMRSQVVAWRTDDFNEGRAAVVERRAPVYRGFRTR